MNRRPSREGGFTLAELLVSMGLMGVFMMIVTASIVMMYGSSGRAEAVVRTSGEITTAFDWMDRHIRYADYVAEVPGGVRLSAPDPVTEIETCFVVRITVPDGSAGGELQWGTSGAADWHRLATVVPAESSVTTDGAAVTLRLAVARTVGERAVTSRSNATFVSVNATGANASPGACAVAAGGDDGVAS